MSHFIAKVPVILVTGKNGQIGWELCRSLLPLGHVVAVGREDIDLLDNQSIVNCIRQLRPNIIINAAAYTAVDKAEGNGLAMQINGIAPGVMAEEAKKLGALFVHYSTDYVFDGEQGYSYTENSVPRPINEYGRTKLAGEEFIKCIDCDHLIFRTSWIFGARRSNFLLTMLKLMQSREKIIVVDDQYGTPTWSKFVSNASALIVSRKLHEQRHYKFESGLFHLASAGETTWYGFAKKIQEFFLDMRKGCRITPVATAEYPTLATRPKNTVLNTTAIVDRFGINIPSWVDCVDKCIQDIQTR